MDFPAAHCCANPMQPWVIVVLGAVVLLFAWTALRSPRPPAWWRTDRRSRKQ